MLFSQKTPAAQLNLIDAQSSDIFYDLNQMLPCYWWDETANFGDWIGPWLISMKTGHKVVNSRHLIHVPKTIFSVGSIIHHLKTINEDVVVWGSGLIKPLDRRNAWVLKRKMDQIHFLGVRGRLTQAELINKLGVEVPDVFGDPALLLPRYYLPKPKLKRRISVCPHMQHYSEFKETFDKNEDLLIIDVKRDPRQVIDDIVNSEVCISSSLHGLIIAQAYGIPWIWLRIEDHTLVGDQFKFLDFFSTLNHCSDQHVLNISRKDLSYSCLMQAASKARLFEYSINLDDLDRALLEY